MDNKNGDLPGCELVIGCAPSYGWLHGWLDFPWQWMLVFNSFAPWKACSICIPKIHQNPSKTLIPKQCCAYGRSVKCPWAISIPGKKMNLGLYQCQQAGHPWQGVDPDFTPLSRRLGTIFIGSRFLLWKICGWSWVELEISASTGPTFVRRFNDTVPPWRIKKLGWRLSPPSARSTPAAWDWDSQLLSRAPRWLPGAPPSDGWVVSPYEKCSFSGLWGPWIAKSVGHRWPKCRTADLRYFSLATIFWATHEALYAINSHDIFKG